MQPQPDYLSVPRRALDFEDYVDILRRHWMWIAGPLFAGLVMSVVVAFLWKDSYQSYAIMRITPSQVSDRIVPTNFNLTMRDRLDTMLQDVTSRSKLIDMVKKFNLYPAEQQQKSLEDIVEEMRPKIKIEPVASSAQQQQPQQRGSSAFRIAFMYEDRFAAQKVVQEMVNSFTSQNIIDRRSKSRITTEFLSEEVKTAKADLDRIETELTAFKLRNAGRLPEELTSNLQMQASYQNQLISIRDALQRNQQDKMMYETGLQNLKNQMNALESAEMDSVSRARSEGKNARLIEAERNVASGEQQLAALKDQVREGHPDLRNMTTRVNLLKQFRDQVASEVAAEEERLAKEMNAAVSERRSLNPAVLAKKSDILAQINGFTTKLKSIDLDSADRVKIQSAIMDNLRQVADRIQSNPLMQGEYAQLTRDYNLAKERYDRLSTQKSSSEVANRLEDRSAGENLEVLDTASLPLKPSDPNRWLIVGVGTGIGLLLGVFLAGAQEVKDTTMKGIKDVRAYSNLQVLSSIPLLENALLVRRKRRLIWLAWSSAMIVGVVVMSSSVYYYYWGRGL